MEYTYYLCDVFSDTAFGGNPLAVVPEASGLTSEQMQQMAREFNFSESTFVLPAERGHTRKVRIFTPTREIPFAGHPNVGTAFVLASVGELGDIPTSTQITFEEKAGLVDITVTRLDNGRFACELKAPEPFSLGKTLSVETVAAALSLSPEELVVANHPPQVASVGLPFVLVEVRDLAALQRSRPHFDRLLDIKAQGIEPDIHVYCRSNDAFDLRARMFAPLDGVPEDPATGSANCALTALLTHLRTEESGQFAYTIAQGVEMGRPSLLESRAEKKAGSVTSVWIGGQAVMMSKGIFFID
ncbi:trans-2,3-dihydro-3-hydroxyanthranilate isomerase [Catalinimonas alkaloidigena]|uniref:Trans-2,3-dihydro-3-hydroxyanthranilate isomerase n=1 Tax=Catalinimonas alkaloidigena TaxID=1075417 RepID=A0A1G9HAY7_9BACT|nr:PhzF family phenazine biosynthesis protein [Catalinimonas alkaloidigena]SDL10178.1 trans-2,3-dihydro-3-hydroxyanthranilate isomerase [Catalinimonas alkaloidigena]